MAGSYGWAATTIAVQKAYKYLSKKKAESDTKLELAKKELIQETKNYDAINTKEHSGKQLIDMVYLKRCDNLEFAGGDYGLQNQNNIRGRR
jgi:hypothetical protein